jgi:hypothetical protein
MRQALRRLAEISDRGGVDIAFRFWTQPAFPFVGIHLHIQFVDDFEESPC